MKGDRRGLSGWRLTARILAAVAAGLSWSRAADDGEDGLGDDDDDRPDAVGVGSSPAGPARQIMESQFDERAGPSLSLESAYEGSDHRDQPWRFEAELVLPIGGQWQVGGFATCFPRSHDETRDPFWHGGLRANWASAEDSGEPLTTSFVLEIAGPGLLAERGVDLLVAWSAECQWSKNLSSSATLGGLLDTGHHADQRAGIGFADVTLSLAFDLPRLHDEAVYVRIAGETGELRGKDTPFLFWELGISASVGEHVDLDLGAGSEWLSPYGDTGFFWRGSIGLTF